MNPRRAELERNLADVQARVDAACKEAKRDPASVSVLAVTKTFPVSDLELLAELGCTDVGESRDQEARPKRDACGALLHWHMIGQVQRNKARHVAAWADVVESVDRVEIADALAIAATQSDRLLRVLIQVSLDGEHERRRGGVRPADLLALGAHVRTYPSLRLAGVMAVAPLGADPLAAFSVLAQAHAELLALAPEATTISAGMSGDLEAAIACGATQVRIGGAILGKRPALK